MGTVCVPVYPGLPPVCSPSWGSHRCHRQSTRGTGLHQALGTQRSIPRDGVLQGGHMPRWAPSLWALSTPSLTAHILPPSPGHLAHLAPPDTSASAWLEPGQGEQHPGDSTTLRILASMPSRTIGECRLPSCPPQSHPCPSYTGLGALPPAAGMPCSPCGRPPQCPAATRRAQPRGHHLPVLQPHGTAAAPAQPPVPAAAQPHGAAQPAAVRPGERPGPRHAAR